MSEQIHIRYHKWCNEDYQRLSRSLKENLNIGYLQFYMPLFSLYYYIHNTARSHKTVDFERKYQLRELLEITKQRYYNSNILGRAIIYDTGRNVSEIKDIFCKTIPILDPIHCINNNYNLRGHNNHHLPSGYNYNTFHKINDINNGAYIDVFCSYLFSQLTVEKKSPSFPIFYGSINGIGEYKYDITEEYHDLRMDKSFLENIGKGFTMDMYVSESESESSDSISSHDSNEPHTFEDITDNQSDLSNRTSSSNKTSEYNDDYIALLHKIPLQLLFIEKLDGTLEDFLNSEEYTEDTLVSAMFQVSFALAYLQRRYCFTHNDLHINNVMYKDTTTPYLYYKINNRYFRIPTYGKIFKIIDFGRAIFTYKHKVYMNDVFSRQGEAGGQYDYPHQVSFFDRSKKKKSQPNYNFDLCRLSMTILDEIPKQLTSEIFLKFLEDMCVDNDGHSFRNMREDFHLYISIANNSNNSLPRKILENSLFNTFRIHKKRFPRKSYYTL
jgi:hypothetical protein